MNSRKLRLALPIIAAALLFAACSTPGLANDTAADIAAVLSDYAAYRDANMTDASEDSVLSLDSQVAADVHARADALDESAKAFNVGVDETVVVVDNGDGTVTVTRSWSVDEGAEMKLVVERPKKPESGDPSWTLDDASGLFLIVANATEERFVNDVKVSSAALTITWAKSVDTVYRYKLLREGETLKPAGTVAVRTLAEWSMDGKLVLKTVTYVKVGTDGMPVERSFTVESVVIDGTVYRKITTEDRDGYAIVKSQKPRVVEYYDAADRLVLVVTHERVTGLGIVITREWYENGAVVRTVEGSMRISVSDDGVVTIKREFGDRKVETSVEETENGYLVTRDGVEYSISSSGGITTIANGSGTWTVEWSPDGEAIVTQIG